MTAALRPRTGREAMDLGFNMAQRWFLPLLLLWCAAAIPLFILLTLLPFISAFWALVIIWWLKPLFEQSQLYYLSRALFGEYPSISQVLKRYWQISRVQLIPLLSWRRLSLTRGFQAPLALLEGLEGEARRTRLGLLSLTQAGPAQRLHVYCFLFERLLWLNLCFLLATLLPGDSFSQNVYPLLTYDDAGWASLISDLFYVLAMAVMAPFYVSAGFSLYLARRSELEGWDIELNFRAIAERLKKPHSRRVAGLSGVGVGLAISLALATATVSEPARASDQAQAKIVIEDILQQEEFGKTETVKRWQFTGEKAEKKAWDLSLLSELAPELARLLEVLLWIAAVVLLLYLLIRFSEPGRRGLFGAKTAKKYRPPARLFGLGVDEESLPEDVLAAVREKLANGQTRAALGLLYRASLSKLIFLHQLEISEAATEGECRRLVERLRPRDEAHYFSALTRVWLLLAYAHETPDPAELSRLCERWPEFYDRERAGP